MIIQSLVTALSTGLGCGTCCGSGVSASLFGYLTTHTGSLNHSFRAFLSFYLGKILAVAGVCLACSLLGRQILDENGSIGSFNIHVIVNILMIMMGVWFIIKWIRDRLHSGCESCHHCTSDPGTSWVSQIRSWIQTLAFRVKSSITTVVTLKGVGAQAAADAGIQVSMAAAGEINGVDAMAAAHEKSDVDAMAAARGKSGVDAMAAARGKSDVDAMAAAESTGVDVGDVRRKGKESVLKKSAVSYPALMAIGAGYGISPCAPLLMMAGYAATLAPVTAFLTGCLFAVASAFVPMLLLMFLTGILSSKLYKEIPQYIGVFRLISYILLIIIFAVTL